MGNVNQGDRLKGDEGINELGIAALRSWPILFHATHSVNVRLSHDRRRAKRVDGVKGVCFSSRPVCIGERVYVRITDSSSTRNGALRFGFTTDDPCTIDESDLPRYAFPDLTNEQGYWAKAVPEAMAHRGIVMFFFISVGSTEVRYGIDNVEVGVFFSGIQTTSPLWALLDLYGSTVAVEFVDGEQITPAGSFISVDDDEPVLRHDHPDPPYYLLPPVCPAHSQSSSAPALSTLPFHAASVHPPHVDIIDPMPFHHVHGRSVILSVDRMVARRAPDEYCNGYAFTCRALHAGERLVAAVTAVERAYVGGLAFGMTSCDPSSLRQADLPDDADLLLDRPEYWVVHKDVCAKPDIGDELSFTLTSLGEVRYARNGHHISTLMHVDTSLPLWAFVDVYGTLKEIKSIGVVITNLVVRSTRSNVRCSHSIASSSSAVTNNIGSLRLSANQQPVATPDTRPLASTGPVTQRGLYRHHPNHHHAAVSVDGPSPGGPVATAEPVLVRPAYDQQLSSLKRLHSSSEIIPSSSSIDAPLEQLSLPPPLIPIPAGQPATMPTPGKQSGTGTRARTLSHPTRRTVTASMPPPVPVRRSIGHAAHEPASAAKSVAAVNETSNSVDAKTAATGPGDVQLNECVVCLERAPDCVLYTCGHMCMCHSCARDVVGHGGALCPVCRQPIRDVIKIFRS